MSTDPTKIRSQPALTRSTGRSWLIVGGLFTAIALGVLIPMTQLPPAGIALGGTIVIAALYLAMIVVRISMPAGRRRLGFLSVGMLAIALIALVAAGIVAGTAAS